MAAPAATSMLTMTDALERWLLPLLTFMSPAYPVGGFAFSHGLEWVVESGDVRDKDDLCDYVGAVIRSGGGFCDLVFLASAWRAARADDDTGLDEIADLAFAWRGSAELALESREQGAAFARATLAVWEAPALQRLSARRGGEIAFPVAVGAALTQTPLDAALLGYAQALAANLVSAGVRLVPLGQTDGLRALAALAPIITISADTASRTTLDAIASSAIHIDVASMRHETQYTRLFRS
jgi:urease accessory protein